jgi:hypothetical protein
MATTHLLIHATGLCALALNVIALVCTCERSMRVQSGIAGIIWALNNLLMGAHTAAALSLVSAGRTATSAATLQSGAPLRRAAFAGFGVLTLAIAAATWQGWPSVLLTIASVLSTYAVFYLRGRRLRWAMLMVSALWMYHAWSYGSWEQMVANVITAMAALYGAWSLTASAKPQAAEPTRHPEHVQARVRAPEARPRRRSQFAARPTLPTGKPVPAPAALRLPSNETLNETICRLRGASANRFRPSDDTARSLTPAFAPVLPAAALASSILPPREMR